MLLKITFALFSAAILSCGSTENQNQNAEANTPAEIKVEKMNGEKMMAAGFLPGTVVYSDLEGDCPYTVQLKGDKMEFYYVDPMNLEEPYQKDQQKVWIKFNGLKRMNRCNKANPVFIEEIQKRAE